MYMLPQGQGNIYTNKSLVRVRERTPNARIIYCRIPATKYQVPGMLCTTDCG